jgi:hypothetical protein
MRLWPYSCLRGHSMVCPNSQTKQYFPQKLLASGGEVTEIFFRTYEKKLSEHITKCPLTSRNFRENTKNFSGHIKIFPKFLSFARILHCFLPDRKNCGGHVPPRPIRLWAYYCNIAMDVILWDFVPRQNAEVERRRREPVNLLSSACSELYYL